MRTALTLLVISTLTLSGCQSRLNPVNWFGGKDQPVATAENTNPLMEGTEETDGGLFKRPDDPSYSGTSVYQVNSVSMQRVSEGSLLSVVGVTSIHGAFDARLVARNDGKPEGGVLTLDLLAIHPVGAYTGGTEQSREITAAVVLTEQDLQGVRSVQVAAASNARSARR